MKLRNTGLTPITLPGGRTVPPGGLFNAAGIPGPQLQAWLTAGNVRRIPEPRRKPEE